MTETKANTTLILGGARSGKSAYAETLCEQSDLSLLYIATSPIFADDIEMAKRIKKHQDRRDKRWRAIEEQTDLPAILEQYNAAGNAILIDCMTLWLNNLLYHAMSLDDHLEKLIASLKASRASIILISNEVGQGIVPATADGRQFRDDQGRLNQALARSCDRVIEVKAGMPMLLKPTHQPPITL